MGTWFSERPGPLAGAPGHNAAAALGTPAVGVGVRWDRARRHRRGAARQVVGLGYRARCAFVPQC